MLEQRFHQIGELGLDALRPGDDERPGARVNCASSSRNGKPPKWSPWKCVIRIRSMASRAMPRRFSAGSDDAPQSIRKLTWCP
jgi:hypothetical protein